VDKPAGWLVIPGRGRPEPTVQQEAEKVFGRLWVVHRLDRGTSGVLLFARDAKTHRYLNIAFEKHRVRKTYLALVKGVAPAMLWVDAPIVPGRRGRMRTTRRDDPRGRRAATSLRLIEVLFPERGVSALSLVEAVAETGRTHQIRLHLAEAGHPLAYDADYGEAEPLRGAGGDLLLDRTPLHASRIEFPEPGGNTLTLESPLPLDMARVLAEAHGAVR
jgi:tRNA pseudouridine32 synthase/23S rRNA pseudouridine746 synthase